ncbi:enoyl-CoA hydratase/isomerase family protein [Streptomyces sp. NPDC057137]|uniref:enoyl-CoA hydratase/isomerase family protein n=1 Tax=Streptomyces sp. NPDC057137 TaxID=3346030 RepID=UPI0036328D36
MSEPVIYARDGATAVITLNRPEVSNAVDLATSQAFDRAISAATSDSGVRTVLVRGAGARFCAGGDVAAMAAQERPSEYVGLLAEHFGRVLLRLSRIEQPVVCAVQGAVAGAGLALALSADLVVAARGTKFLMAYGGVGLTPDCGVSHLLPRAIGQQRALELALTNRVITASTALDWGLVGQVVDEEALPRAASELVAALGAGSAFAHGQAKRLIRSSWEAPREQGIDDEAATIVLAADTAHARTKIGGFIRRDTA